jgi:hypothetical protein
MESATYGRMDTQNVTAMEATEVTEIEERIESQKESAALMRKALDCECPDNSCPVAHES